MSTSETLSTTVPEPSQPEFQYRAMSTGAIAAALLGVLSVLTFVAGRDSLQACLLMCPIPVVGIVIGRSALKRIRELPDQFGGRKLATFGVSLSLFCLVAGLGYSGYVYGTEVPEGYARISFNMMRPDEVQQRAGTIIPLEIAQLDGQKVFIKGYFRPGSSSRKHNVRKFLLVRDSANCCYGDINKVKYYDMMSINIVGSVAADFSFGLFRMGGTLHVNAENLRRGPGYPIFTLEADYVR